MMSISENICPVCKQNNDLESVVCWYCGAALEDPFLDPGAKTKTTDMPAVAPEIIRDWATSGTFDGVVVPENGIALYVEGEPNPASIDLREEFVIGRKVGTTSEGLLDLAPLGGYHLGLSRRHALVRRTEQGYEVLDLGSVNGTWLNNEKLAPHTTYPLPSGSHLRLGTMRLFVLYRALGNPKEKI